jgi:hypothetical protein
LGAKSRILNFEFHHLRPPPPPEELLAGALIDPPEKPPEAPPPLDLPKEGELPPPPRLNEGAE